MFLVRIRSASSRLVFGGAVTRLSLVMTSSIRSSFDSRNRRSRRVRMPRSRPLTVIGTPEMLCPLMISRACPTVAVGGSVIGSTMIPFSDRLTLSTSRVCSSIDMFLWITPRPPSCASAIANSASVTVSIGDDRIGMFSGIWGVRWVRVSTWRGRSSE